MRDTTLEASWRNLAISRVVEYGLVSSVVIQCRGESLSTCVTWKTIVRRVNIY